METPDKTYPLSIVGDLLASTAPSEVVYMPDKIYFDGVDTSTTPRLAINEEYIRKDKIREMIMYTRNISQTPDAAIRNWDELIKKIDEL